MNHPLYYVLKEIVELMKRKKVKVIVYTEPGYLFLGGPLDGQNRELREPIPWVKVAKPSKPQITFKETETLSMSDCFIETVEYERQEICHKLFHFSEPHFSYIYVKRGMKIGFG